MMVTTRVGNGRSARLIALAVVGVLVGVVGYAFVNRPPPPPTPAVALAPATPGPATPGPATPEPPPTPLPTPTPPRNQLEGNDGTFGWAVVSQLPFRRPASPLPPTEPPVYTYVVSMNITGGVIRAALEREVADLYAGKVVIGSADVGENLVIEVGRQWSQDGRNIFESFGAWEVPLKPLRKSRVGRMRLLVEHVPPSDTPSVPAPIATGYTFTVLGRRDGSRMTFFMELVWPPAARHRLTTRDL